MISITLPQLKKMRKIDKIIIHCSYTFHDMDIGADEIRYWHMAKGWKDIGYHYVIRRDGTLEAGRHVSKIGAHVKGKNRNSIGCCFIGGKEGHGEQADNFTLQQMQIGRMLMQDFKRDYPGVTFHGHNEFSKKACPVFDIEVITPLVDERV